MIYGCAPWRGRSRSAAPGGGPAENIFSSTVSKLTLKPPAVDTMACQLGQRPYEFHLDPVVRFGLPQSVCRRQPRLCCLASGRERGTPAHVPGCGNERRAAQFRHRPVGRQVGSQPIAPMPFGHTILVETSLRVRRSELSVAGMWLPFGAASGNGLDGYRCGWPRRWWYLLNLSRWFRLRCRHVI